MFTKRTINTLLAGSLLATPALFMAMEPSNPINGWDRIGDFSTGVVLAGGAVMAQKYAYHAPDKLAYCLRALSAPLAASSLLFGAKAFSNTTWTDILQNKKAALGKYFLYGSAAAFLGMNLPKLVKDSTNLIPDTPYTEVERDIMGFGVGGVMIGLAGNLGRIAYKHLNKVLEAPATPAPAPSTKAATALMAVDDLAVADSVVTAAPAAATSVA